MSLRSVLHTLPPLGVAFATAAVAQQPAPVPAAAPAPAQAPAAAPKGPSTYATPIGPSISLDNAKKAAAAASAEARKNGWFMAIAVVDPAGTLVYFEKNDTTQHGSSVVAIDKARSAALFKRPTKAFEETVAKGGAGVRILGLTGAVPLEGGLPLMIDGKMVGGIGVSGDMSENDGKCAAAAVAALATTTASR